MSEYTFGGFTDCQNIAALKTDHPIIKDLNIDEFSHHPQGFIIDDDIDCEMKLTRDEIREWNNDLANFTNLWWKKWLTDDNDTQYPPWIQLPNSLKNRYNGQTLPDVKQWFYLYH